jgi:hypothetical protein
LNNDYGGDSNCSTKAALVESKYTFEEVIVVDEIQRNGLTNN